MPGGINQGSKRASFGAAAADPASQSDREAPPPARFGLRSVTATQHKLRTLYYQQRGRQGVRAYVLCRSPACFVRVNNVDRLRRRFPRVREFAEFAEDAPRPMTLRPPLANRHGDDVRNADHPGEVVIRYGGDLVGVHRW